MKNLIFTSSLVFFITTIICTVFAGGGPTVPPDAISYQTVIRDASGDIIPNQTVSMKFLIRQGTPSGTVVYSELHSPTTNEFGLVNLEIGRGTPDSTSFNSIAWPDDKHFTEVLLDENGGSSFTSMGAQEMLSVPYAFYSGDDGDWTVNNDTISVPAGKFTGIGTPSPDQSSALDVVSANGGFLLPRMTSIQRDAIAAPAQSLMVYNTTDSCLQIYIGNLWINIACGGDTLSACTVPLPPQAMAATNITESSFTANWSTSSGASNYRIDVAADSGFTIPVQGYINLDLGNDSSYTVTGLTCNFTFYYRLRAENSCGLSEYSNVVAVPMAACPLSPSCFAIWGINNDYGNDIIQTADGGYAIAGYTLSYGEGGEDLYALKLDADGSIVWTRTVGGTGGDRGNAIIQTTDGGYAIAGYTQSFGSGGADLYLVRLDANGNVSWTRTVGGSAADLGWSVVQSSDGGFVVAGYTGSFGAGSYDYYVVKLSATGVLLWTRTIGGSAADYGFSVIETVDGGFAVAGYANGYGSGNDAYIVKLDSNGNVIWNTLVGGSSNEECYDIIQTSDVGYVITGNTASFGAGGYDTYIVKLDSSGSISWSRTVGGTGQDYGRSVISTADNGYAVAGHTQSFGAGTADFYMIKLDNSGNVDWTRTVGGTAWEDAYALVQTTDGGYVLGGYTNSFGAAGVDNIYLVKLDSNGNACAAYNPDTGGIYNSGGTTSTGGASSSGGVLGSGGYTGSGGTKTDVCQ